MDERLALSLLLLVCVVCVCVCVCVCAWRAGFAVTLKERDVCSREPSTHPGTGQSVQVEAVWASSRLCLCHGRS